MQGHSRDAIAHPIVMTETAPAEIVVPAEQTPAEQAPAEQAPPAKKRGAPGKKRVPGSKRPPARPHRKVPEDTLLSRIAKLTARVERTRRQHDAAQILLTKYAREKGYRDEDAIAKEAETA